LEFAQEDIGFSPDAVAPQHPINAHDHKDSISPNLQRENSGNPHLGGGISMCITGMANNHKFILLLAGIELPATC